MNASFTPPLIWTCRSCGRSHVYRLKNICDCYGAGLEETALAFDGATRPAVLAKTTGQ